MAKVTPQEAAEKWNRRTKGATADYTRGVQRVTEAPGAKAAAQAERYAEGVRRAVEEGKWQERVAAVSLGEWQSKAVNKGAPRIAAGVEEATSDMTKFMGELLPHIDSGQAQVNAMPKGSIEDSIARATTFMRHMASFKRSAR